MKNKRDFESEKTLQLTAKVNRKQSEELKEGFIIKYYIIGKLDYMILILLK